MSRLSAETLGSKYQLVAAWVELARLTSDVSSVVNGPPDKIYHASSVNKLSEASEQLLTWFTSLDANLQWTGNCAIPPGTCALHLQFLSTTILLNRPFAAYMFNSGPRSASRCECLKGQTPEVSQEICTMNALRISKILLTYREQHGPSKIFSTINPACLSAAVALISDIVSAKSDEDKTPERMGLASILKTLEEITPWYPIAARSRNTLAAILQMCGLSDIPNQLSTDLGNSSMRTSLGHCPGEPSASVTTTDMDLSFDLGFPFDSIYDIHDIGLPDFYVPPWQIMDSEHWGSEALPDGFNI